MKWDESKHPRDELGRFTDANGSYRQNTQYWEILADQEQREVESATSPKDDYSDIPTIKLPRAEYAMVMHELATNLTEEEHKFPTAIKHIRNHTYRIVINGFGDYRIIGKWEIEGRRRKKLK